MKENLTTSNKFKGDGVIWTVFFFLCIISIIEVFSASSNLSFKTGDYLKPVIKHCLLLLLGVFAMVATMNVKCKYFKIVTPFALIFSFFGLIAVFAFGEVTNGSQRWLSLFGIQFQPSELAKGALILATAQILSAMQTVQGADRSAFKYILIVCVFIVPLIMLENLSTAALLCLVIFIMMFIGKVPKVQLGRLLGVVAISATLAVSGIMLIGHDKSKDDVKDEKMFFRVVKAAFGQRRKTLHNALCSAGLTKELSRDVLLRAGIDPRRRGETLSLDEFAHIADNMPS